MHRVINFLEKMWLMLAIVTLVLAVYKTFASTIEDAAYFYVFCVVSIIFYFLRKRQRVHFNEQQNDKSSSEQ
jgi:preprotein translocase subunit SecG